MLLLQGKRWGTGGVMFRLLGSAALGSVGCLFGLAVTFGVSSAAIGDTFSAACTKYSDEGSRFDDGARLRLKRDCARFLAAGIRERVAAQKWDGLASLLDWAVNRLGVCVGADEELACARKLDRVAAPLPERPRRAAPPSRPQPQAPPKVAPPSAPSPAPDAGAGAVLMLVVVVALVLLIWIIVYVARGGKTKQVEVWREVGAGERAVEEEVSDLDGRLGPKPRHRPGDDMEKSEGSDDLQKELERLRMERDQLSAEVKWGKNWALIEQRGSAWKEMVAKGAVEERVQGLGERVCSECRRKLDIEPALEGATGMLCFPCGYRLDFPGRLEFPAKKQEYESELRKWRARYEYQWATYNALCQQARAKGAFAWSALVISLGGLILFGGKVGTFVLLLGVLVAVIAFVQRGALRRKATENSCPSPPVEPMRPVRRGYGDPKVIFGREPPSEVNPEYVRISGGYPADWRDRQRRCVSRDGNHCRLCGSTSKLHVHHVVPVSLGGSHSLQNLITLCKSCHMGQEYYRHKALVRANIRRKEKYRVNSYTRADGVEVRGHDRGIGRRGKFWRDVRHMRGGGSTW